MKNILYVIFLIFCQVLHGQSFQVMSYNIRYGRADDGEDNWALRKGKMADLLRYYEPGILGVQEALDFQVRFLDSVLVNYRYVGVGRDDGMEKGEYSAIFYDTTLFTLQAQSTFWLSETPDQISVGWDAAMERICTWAELVRKSDRQHLWVFNTHFDHIGKQARLRSAELILDRIRSLLPTSETPVILMGDLNMPPEDPGVKRIANELSDSRTASIAKPYGPYGTFNGFDLQYPLNKRIDYIFSKKLKVLKQVHIDDQTDDHRYPSDHFPVMTEVRL